MKASSGFSLVELLIATAVTLSVTAVIVALLDPARASFAAQTEAADMQQRLRVASDVVRQDLMTVGAGPARGERAGPLNGYFAAVLPRHLDDAPSNGPREDAVTVVYVFDSAAQASIDTAMRAESVTVSLRSQPGCPVGDPLCGFASGQQVVVYDDTGAFSLFTVTGTTGTSLRLRHETADAAHVFPVGSTIASAAFSSYGLRTDAATGVSQLTRDDGTRQVPVADHVVGLSFEYFGERQPPRVLPDSSLERPRTTYGPPPLPGSASGFAPGENCVFVRDSSNQPVPRLPVLTGAGGPVRLSVAQFEDGPWCPDAGHPGRFDADLLRVRRVVTRMRVQSADAAFRGPAGPLFTHGGRARRGVAFVPDVEIGLDVSPRNLNIRH